MNIGSGIIPRMAVADELRVLTRVLLLVGGLLTNHFNGWKHKIRTLL